MNKIQDRSELNDLAKKRPARVARMAALWENCHRRFVEQSGVVRD
jgi:hypothetical protein